MLNKIKRTYWYMASEEMANFVREAEEMVEKYGWQDRATYPYPNCPVKVTKIIEDCRDYSRCTSGTKEYLISLVNGLVPILNSWEEYELAPKVSVRIKGTGKVVRILKDDLDLFEGLYELAE